MPGLVHLIIVAPNADQAGVLAETGFHTDADLYLASDPMPRTKWGGWTATQFTTAQQAQVPTWQADFPASTFVQYNVATQKGVPAQTLTDLGLTTDQGT